jgi:microcystin-dependent protein
MALTRKLRSYFAIVTRTATAAGTRFLKNDKPTQESFQYLRESTAFMAESADRAKGYVGSSDLADEQGLVVLATDPQAKNNQAQLADRSLVAQPHQLPTVTATETDAIDLATGTDYSGVSLTVTVDAGITTRNKYMLKLSTAFKTWIKTVIDEITTAATALAARVTVTEGDITTIVNTTLPAAIAAAAAESTPIGVIMPYIFPTAPNDKWRITNGFVVLVGDYPELHAALIAAGSPYGVSGADPLAPDTQNRMLRHTPLGIGTYGGSDTASLIEANVPSHTHTYSGTTSAAGSHTHVIKLRLEQGASDPESAVPINNVNYDPGAASDPTTWRSDYTSADTAPNHDHTFSGTTSSGSGSGTAFSVLNAYIGINCIMRVKP